MIGLKVSIPSQIDEFRIQNHEFCIKMDEFCINMMHFVFKLMNFPLQMLIILKGKRYITKAAMIKAMTEHTALKAAYVKRHAHKRQYLLRSICIHNHATHFPCDSGSKLCLHNDRSRYLSSWAKAKVYNFAFKMMNSALK